MALSDTESRVWPATGVKPAAGDETYEAGEQPIAPHDNWVMWAITTDLHNAYGDIASHGSRHEANGADEIDLQNLKINGVAALNADATDNEVRLVDTDTNASVLRVNVSSQTIKQFPRFDVAPRLAAGASVGNDITNSNNTAIYDVDAGAEGKFHHAKYADRAQVATYAENAESVEGYNPDLFLQPDDNATITGLWEFTSTINGDISGNAATADHATTAQSANQADYATEAGNSDTLDGYHAQDLITSAQQSGEWSKITEATHTDPGTDWSWNHQSATAYDLYRLTIYQEAHTTEGYHPFLWLRVGQGGAVDRRWRYNYMKRNVDADGFEENTNDGWVIAQGWHDTISVHEHVIACPRAVNSPGNHWPVYGTSWQAVPTSNPHNEIWGELQTDYSYIDTFQFNVPEGEWAGDIQTGRVVLRGKNL